MARHDACDGRAYGVGCSSRTRSRRRDSPVGLIPPLSLHARGDCTGSRWERGSVGCMCGAKFIFGGSVRIIKAVSRACCRGSLPPRHPPTSVFLINPPTPLSLSWPIISSPAPFAPIILSPYCVLLLVALSLLLSLFVAHRVLLDAFRANQQARVIHHITVS